jgi:hypothetical protein
MRPGSRLSEFQRGNTSFSRLQAPRLHARSASAARGDRERGATTLGAD